MAPDVRSFDAVVSAAAGSHLGSLATNEEMPGEWQPHAASFEKLKCLHWRLQHASIQCWTQNTDEGVRPLKP